jgi:hypothetical protein
MKDISMYMNMMFRGFYICDRHNHQDIVIELYAEEDVTTYQECN